MVELPTGKVCCLLILIICILSHACNTLPNLICHLVNQWCPSHHHFLGSGSPWNGRGYVWRRSNSSRQQVLKPQAHLISNYLFARPISFSFVSSCRLFQVTWLKNNGFIYDRHNFTKVCYCPSSRVYPSYRWHRPFAFKPWSIILISHLIWISAFFSFLFFWDTNHLVNSGCTISLRFTHVSWAIIGQPIYFQTDIQLFFLGLYLSHSIGFSQHTCLTAMELDTLYFVLCFLQSSSYPPFILSSE
jgi:hypothetical protein